MKLLGKVEIKFDDDHITHILILHDICKRELGK